METERITWDGRDVTDSAIRLAQQMVVFEELAQCEACLEMVLVDSLRTSLPAAGIEGSFCKECRLCRG